MSTTTDSKPKRSNKKVGTESIYHQESYAAIYDDGNFGGAFGDFLRRQEVDTLLSLLEGPQERILDVGAGTGKLSIPLYQKYPLVISVDASPQMLNVAKQNGDRASVSLSCLVCDAQSLSFAGQYFDSVLMSRTLMHLPEWKKGLSEVCRVSRGTVVIDFPPIFGVTSIGHLLRRLHNLLPSGTQNYRLFSTGSVVKEFQKNNFSVVYLNKQYFLPVGFHRWLNRPKLSMGLERFCAVLGLNRMLGGPVTIKAVRNGSSQALPTKAV